MHIQELKVGHSRNPRSTLEVTNPLGLAIPAGPVGEKKGSAILDMQLRNSPPTLTVAAVKLALLQEKKDRKDR